MKKLLMLMAVALCCGTAIAKDNGKNVKSVPVTAFDEVTSTAGIDIYYTQSSKHECKVNASAKDIDKVVVKVEGRNLVISVKTQETIIGGVRFNTASFSDKVTVSVTSPELKRVNCIGSGDFIATNDIKSSEETTFTITGSSNMRLKTVTAPEIKLNIAGSGDIELPYAKCKELKANVSGSGGIDIAKVDGMCGKASLNVSGSGDINATFNDCESLKCNVAGSGDIEVAGNVVDYSASIIGSGNIKKSGLAVSGECHENNIRSHSGIKARTINGINAEP